MTKPSTNPTSARQSQSADDSHKLTSAWSPLRVQIFRALWIASIASYIGTWMQDVGESWLMTSLTTSPVLVALIETAGNLPVVLLALPAGALADVVDRRRLLLIMQSWMCVTAGAMGLLAVMGQMTPSRLLLLSFVLGVGAAMSNPVWQAITPELVPASDLPAALALSSVGINIARAIGPALGGLIIGASGPWAAFFLNAASFSGVVIVIYRWRPAPRKSALPPEDIVGAMRAVTPTYPSHLRHCLQKLIRTFRIDFVLDISDGRSLVGLWIDQDYWFRPVHRRRQRQILFANQPIAPRRNETDDQANRGEQECGRDAHSRRRKSPQCAPAGETAEEHQQVNSHDSCAHPGRRNRLSGDIQTRQHSDPCDAAKR